MELTADVGKGYVPAVANRPADAPIGLIPVDSLFSPIKQVATRSRTPASARNWIMTACR
jgi:DNA-directed RNA polymerase alpha subunit